MTEEILKFTKLTFIIHAIVAIIFTALFFIPDITVPLFFGSIAAANVYTHAMSLTIGSLFLGLAVSSICGIFVKEWKQIKIVVILEVAWLIAALVTTIISIPAFNVGMVVLTIIFDIIMLALFFLTFLQQEDKMNPIF